MTPYQFILSAVLAWPVYYADRAEPSEARQQRAELLAQVVIDTTSNPDERLWLVTQAGFESGLAEYVLNDRCHEGPEGQNCDGGKSTSPWQVKEYCQGAWQGAQREGIVVTFPDGSRAERWRAAAQCALRNARAGRRRCKNWSGAFAAQLTFARSKVPSEPWCAQNWAFERVKWMRHLAVRQ